MTAAGGGSGGGGGGRSDRSSLGPVGRLFGSLANALIDLGLPTIREWLRDRIGPAADVAQVTTDGSLVHLDGVRIPIGPRGLLVLNRATAAITALGRAGLPEMRLHAFTGVLRFEDGGKAQSPSTQSLKFQAEVSFRAAPNPEEAAWIWGELEIHRAMWPAREGSPPMNPMHGRARLFVSSRDWRIDAGRLDGEIVRAHFAGSGVFEKDDDDDANDDDRRGTDSKSPPANKPLVPRALTSASLKLEHARVGPFVDAASSLVGQGINVPSFVPLDAQLDGDLSWNVSTGGRADLRIVSEAMLRATVRGSIGPTGEGLAGKVDADVHLASLLRGANAPLEAIPREEDSLHVDLDIGGELKRPAVNGTITAAEIGFRLGRPRFVPAILLRNLKTDVFVKDERAVVRAEAFARTSRVSVDVEAGIHALASSARGTLRGDVIEASFLRDITATLGAKLLIPDKTTASIDFTLTPGTDAEAKVNASYGGSITLTTPESKLVLDVSKGDGRMRLTGGVTASDVMATGVFAESAVYPTEGDLTVLLDVVRDGERMPHGFEARGTAAAARLALALRDRPDIAPYVLEGARVNVAIDREAFVYDNLRFRGYGGLFVAKGTIPFLAGDRADLPRIDLELEEGGGELAAVLSRLAPKDSGVHVTAARAAKSESAHQAPQTAETTPPQEHEIVLPPELSARGTLRLLGDASLIVDVAFETPAGSAFDAALRLAHGGSLDGSRLRGAIALVDLLGSGAIPADVPLAPEGIVDVDALVRGHGDETLITGWASAPRLALRGFIPSVSVGPETHATAGSAKEKEKSEEKKIPLPELVFADVIARVRINRDGVMWNPIEGRAYRGSFTSDGRASFPTGLFHTRLELVSIALHELPKISGQEPASYVRGDLSGVVVMRVEGKGPIHATGEIVIDAATFPALNLMQPTLARYGLRPPNEDATRPVTADIVGNDWGLSIRDLKIDLHGASLRGEVGLSGERMLEGHAEVTLEEEYLRTSKLLTLPRVLTERLVLPVTINGPIDSPRVHADLGESLGRFLMDNRVRQFVTSAVEEAQILLGRHPISDRVNAPDRPIAEPALESSLREAIDAHAADWKEITERQKNWARAAPHVLRVRIEPD